MRVKLNSCQLLLKNKATKFRKLIFGILAEYRLQSIQNKVRVAQINHKTALRLKFNAITALIDNKILKNKAR